MNNTIAITGYGIISAIGNNAEEVLESLREKRTGIGPMRYLQSWHTELPVGEVKLSNNELKQKLGVETDNNGSYGVCGEISRTALLGAIAARQAVQMARIDTTASNHLAFVSGTTVAGMDNTESLFHQMKTDDTPLPLIMHHECGASTLDTARLSGLDMAQSTTISTACSSALNAIIVGAEMLQSGEADIVIAGGAEALSRFHLNGFNTLMILDKEQCRPFDETRAGLNLGEGAAYLVLERTADAEKRGATPLGWIAGYGNACDAFHQTASTSDGEGAYLAMQKAIATAGLKPTDIDYVNAHGTGTPNNDPSESEALRRIFGGQMPPVSSTKSFTGHTTSASGSIEAVISLLAMQNGFIPSNLGWKTAMSNGFKPTLGADNVQLRNVLCNSFAFGGNDSSLILSADEPQNKKETVTPAKIRVCTAATSVIDSMDALKDSRRWISAMEGRRMGKLLKAATMTSLDALQKAGITSPDAIITATSWGMIETTEQFLDDMVENGESLLKPTLFMQSTHNTLGSAIAIRTACHGYNITYSHGCASFDQALRDARRLIETGQAKTVLVGEHDETAPYLRDFFRRLGIKEKPEIYSKSIVLKCC